MTPRQLRWSPEEQHSIQELLTRANGPRTSRTLTIDDVRATIDAALASATGFTWRHGGVVDDAREVTTVCLVGVRPESVTVGVSVAHARGLVPSWAWPDLSDWDRASDAANSAQVAAWAARRKENRVALALLPRPAPSSSLEALLERVHAEPDDDAARLVYADALSDRSDPRGEFISLQCARSRLRPTERGLLQVREEALLTAHRAEWLAGLPAGVECHFERGFVQAVNLADSSALAGLDAFIEREPVTRLRVGRGGVRAAASIRWLERLVSLEFYDNDSADVPTFLGQLLLGRVFGRLRELALTRSRITKAAVVLAQLAGTSMPRLSTFGLRESVDGYTFASLFGAPWFKALRVLDLADNSLRLEGLRGFFNAPHSKLQSLVLDGNQLHDEGAKALARAATFTGLESLSLARNRIGPEGAEALIDSPHLRPVRNLCLDQNPIGTRAKEHLAKTLSRRAGSVK